MISQSRISHLLATQLQSAFGDMPSGSRRSKRGKFLKLDSIHTHNAVWFWYGWIFATAISHSFTKTVIPVSRGDVWKDMKKSTWPRSFNSQISFFLIRANSSTRCIRYLEYVALCHTDTAFRSGLVGATVLTIMLLFYFAENTKATKMTKGFRLRNEGKKYVYKLHSPLLRTLSSSSGRG